MKIDKELIDKLLKEGKSYKEIVEITGYNKNSVYVWCWKHYGKLEDKQKSRRQSIQLTESQKEFLFGTLMGDGNLQLFNKNKTSVIGRINHSIKQTQYCIYKQKLFDNISYPVKETIKYLKTTNKEYKQCYFCFKPNTELLQIYNLFYTNGKKDVPEDLSLLTPKALALWFMDDGTASSNCSISIATCSFSLEGLLRLKEFLKEKYNLNVTIQKDFKLYFSAESARKFYEITKPYLIPEMLYKFKYISADLKLR